jgi:hypothetical protein
VAYAAARAGLYGVVLHDSWRRSLLRNNIPPL